MKMYKEQRHGIDDRFQFVEIIEHQVKRYPSPSFIACFLFAFPVASVQQIAYLTASDETLREHQTIMHRGVRRLTQAHICASIYLSIYLLSITFLFLFFFLSLFLSINLSLYLSDYQLIFFLSFLLLSFFSYSFFLSFFLSFNEFTSFFILSFFRSL